MKSSDKEELVSAEDTNPHVRANSSKVKRLEGSEELVGLEEEKVGIFTQWRAAVKKQRPGAPLSDKFSDFERRQRQLQEGRRQKKLKGWGMGLGGVVVAALIFCGVIFYSPLLAIRTITVENANLLSTDYVQSKLAGLQGVPLSRVDEQQVKDLLGQSAVLSDVVVESRPPHELVVKLQERVPVAVVEENKKFYLVDAEGTQLGTVESAKDTGVPVIGGGLKATEKDSFPVVTKVLASLPSSLISEVAQTKADSASTITLEMKDGSRVVWGTAAESEVKAKVLATLMKSVGAEQEVKTYDVSSPLHPTVK